VCSGLLIGLAETKLLFVVDTGAPSLLVASVVLVVSTLSVLVGGFSLLLLVVVISGFLTASSVVVIVGWMTASLVVGGCKPPGVDVGAATALLVVPSSVRVLVMHLMNMQAGSMLMLVLVVVFVVELVSVV